MDISNRLVDLDLTGVISCIALQESRQAESIDGFSDQEISVEQLFVQ